MLKVSGLNYGLVFKSKMGVNPAIYTDLSTYPQVKMSEMWITVDYLGHCTSMSSLM